VRRWFILSLFLGAAGTLVGCSPPEVKVSGMTINMAKTTPGVSEDNPQGTRKSKGTTGDFEQTGEFRAHKATTGEVVFPIPYKEPPVVELKVKLGLHDVEVVESRTTGFKWKNNGKREFLDEPDMLFTAKGVPIPGQELKAFEQKGEFQAAPQATGSVTFPEPYKSTPHVELATKFGLHKIVITKTTATGFEWRSTQAKGFPDSEMSYTVRGVKK
jgi:hypothetical protein